MCFTSTGPNGRTTSSTRSGTCCSIRWSTRWPGRSIAVPTRGVERWLSQRLSHRLGASNGAGDGVCANIDFPFPGGLVAAAMTAALGPGLPQFDKDPSAPQRSVWPLLQLVDEHLDDEPLWPLAAHLPRFGPGWPGQRPAALRCGPPHC